MISEVTQRRRREVRCRRSFPVGVPLIVISRPSAVLVLATCSLPHSSRTHTADGQLDRRNRVARQPGLNREVDDFGAHFVFVRMRVKPKHPLHDVRVLRSPIYCHAYVKSKLSTAVKTLALSARHFCR